MFLYGVVSKNLTTSLALEATVNLSLTQKSESYKGKQETNLRTRSNKKRNDITHKRIALDCHES